MNVKNRAWLTPLLLAFTLTACFELPESASETLDTSALDEDSLRELTQFDSLGICTEQGWTGNVVNSSTSDLEIDIAVQYTGLGSEVLGDGETTIRVPADSTAEFEVVPSPPLDDIAIACNIEMTRLLPLITSD